MDHKSVSGYIYRMFNSKEADRVVSLIDDHGEKITLVAKGVKKPGSRKSHALDLLSRIDCKTTTLGSLPMITDIKLIKSPDILKSSYSGLIFVQLICEVVDQYVQVNQEDKGYYNNLESLVNIPSDQNLALLAAAFILRYLYINGSLPKLNLDVETEQPFDVDDEHYLSEQPGYVHHPLTSVSEPVPVRLVKIQKYILNNGFSEIQKINLTVAEQIQLLQMHLQWHYLATDREIKSLPLFLDSISK